MNRTLILLGFCIGIVSGCGSVAGNPLHNSGGPVPVVSDPPPPAPPPTAGVVTLLGDAHSLVLAVAPGSEVVQTAWAAEDGIHYRRSVDGGATWGRDVLASAVPTTNPFVQLVVDADGAPVILWLDDGPVAWASWSPDGSQWTTVQVSQAPVVSPVLTVGPTGTITVSWIDGEGVVQATSSSNYNKRLLWARATGADVTGLTGVAGSQGQTYLAWTAAADASSCTVMAIGVGTPTVIGQGCGAPVVAVGSGGGEVAVGFSGTVRESRDQGQSWGPAGAVGGPVGSMAVEASGQVDVAWGADGTVFESSSTDHGSTFSQPVALSPPPRQGFAGSGQPVVAADGSVAWKSDGDAVTREVYAIFLNGVNVSQQPQVNDSEGPLMVVTGNGTRVVGWGDGTNVYAVNVPKGVAK